jgi:hypothetical protein
MLHDNDSYFQLVVLTCGWCFSHTVSKYLDRPGEEEKKKQLLPELKYKSNKHFQ